MILLVNQGLKVLKRYASELFTQNFLNLKFDPDVTFKNYFVCFLNLFIFA